MLDVLMRASIAEMVRQVAIDKNQPTEAPSLLQIASR
jgi:hypothetical protein